MSETATPAASNASHAYRADIDGLRAVAVAIVIGFHAKLTGFDGGFIGVDVFFVISGYLISGIIWSALDRGTFSFANFYVRRIRRIVPALVVILFATALLGWLFLYTRELTRLGKHVLAGAAFVSNFVLVKEIGYFDLPDKPLLHLWSLAVEEQFYLIWPAISFIVWKRGWSPRWTLIALIEISFVAGIWMLRHSMVMGSFYFPISRFWEILAGALLYDLQAHPGSINRLAPYWTPRVKEAASILGAILIAASIVAFSEDSPWPGFFGLIPVTGTVLLIAAGPGARINRVILSHPWVVGVGLISYPLYLWHWPLLVFARLVHEGDPPVFVRLIVVALAVLLSILTYRLLELPIRFGPRRKRTVPTLLSALAAAGVLGWFTWQGRIPSLLDTSEVRNFSKWGPDWDAPNGRLVNDGTAIEYFVIRGTGPDTVLILGDSHAEQYWPRAGQLAKEGRKNFPTVVLISYGSCPPVPGANNTGLSWERNRWRCDAIHEAAMRFAEGPGVRTIVFAAFWEGYLMRRTLFLTEDPKRTILTETQGPVDRLFEKFEAELRELRSRGKQAYIVLSNPTVPPRQSAGLPLRLRWGGRPVVASPIPRPYVVSRTAHVTPRLRTVAERAGAQIIDPMEFLCDDAACPTVTADSMPIFRDGDHMRSGFIRERARFLDPIFEPSR